MQPFRRDANAHRQSLKRATKAASSSRQRHPVAACCSPRSRGGGGAAGRVYTTIRLRTSQNRVVFGGSCHFLVCCVREKGGCLKTKWLGVPQRKKPVFKAPIFPCCSRFPVAKKKIFGVCVCVGVCMPGMVWGVRVWCWVCVVMMRCVRVVRRSSYSSLFSCCAATAAAVDCATALPRFCNKTFPY
jgi:hypothetical protein